MRVAHDKCGSLQVNTGELICMLKIKHLVLTFVVKSNH